MPRPIFGHFLLIFGLFWPMFGFIAYLLENCSLFCLHWTDSKQLLKKMLLENFGPFFTHFRPFFTFFLQIWRIFVYVSHFQPIFCSNLAIVMAPNSKICLLKVPLKVQSTKVRRPWFSFLILSDFNLTHMGNLIVSFWQLHMTSFVIIFASCVNAIAKL